MERNDGIIVYKCGCIAIKSNKWWLERICELHEIELDIKNRIEFECGCVASMNERGGIKLIKRCKKHE